jgi:hypothetical protein
MHRFEEEDRIDQSWPEEEEMSREGTDLAQVEIKQEESSHQPSHRGMTPTIDKKRDSGTAPADQNERSALTGKLCKRVLVLIKWQCSADTAVDDRMVQALTGWLRKRGISIYTETI